MTVKQDLYEKRTLGIESQMALNALGETARKREEKILRHAEDLYVSDELTAERALSALIGLLESRKLLSQLSVQAETGVRAARRIEQTVAADAQKVPERTGNRFFRSSVGS